eukprot:CAMPEP_0167749038 /NCGR_PEP_ID=MMETSP0110_2-20121227/5176_1 /TAXON_ID=629695 /ORGANISM="Gymnochlora sp., Strain CCMP2014" /LENGTH=753 /DNA_ID=CAMNT_0007634129 /DNA_START=45 /DNA_END=2306 /DNA_ORIENTATION=+
MADKKEVKETRSYILSATLVHASGARDIAVESNNRILVAEANTGTVRVWDKKDPVGWNVTPMTEGNPKLHNGLCMVVASLKDAKGLPSMTYVSGGGDKRAILFSANGIRLGELSGHTNAVHSVSVSSTGLVITGSWDGITREWSGTQKVFQYPAHKNSAVVLGLPTGEIITAGGEGDICIYKNRALVKKVKGAHGHVVRKVVRHPLGFATCANDGTVKVWSNTGDLLIQFVAYGEDTKFVYGLCAVPKTNELVTCDDGSNVKIWSADGKLIQTIIHPAIVRSVQALPNGDIVTAGSDGFARIFTRSTNRTATSQEVQAFEDAAKKDMQEIDLKGLPTEEALMKPGEKDGQVGIFNVQGKAMVYRWNADAFKWDCVGQAMGSGKRKPKAKKTVLNGKEYDHVTKVFITNEHSVMLGWNVDDDPRDVVENFSRLYNLTDDLSHQVYQFVAPKTDPALIRARKDRERIQARERATKHVPNWQKFGMRMFPSTTNVAAMKKRLQKALNAGTAVESDKQAFLLLMSNIENTSKYHTSPFTGGEHKVVLKMVDEFKDKDLLATLDCLRILMQHAAAVSALSGDLKVRKLLLDSLRASGSSKSMLTLTMRVLANLVARRPRTELERKNGIVAADIEKFILDAVSLTGRCVDKKAPASVQVSASVFLANVICWMGSNKIDAMKIVKAVVDIIVPTLKNPGGNAGSNYYYLVAIASAARLNEKALEYIAPLVKIVPEVFSQLPTQTDAVQEAYSDFKKTFSI